MWAALALMESSSFILGCWIMLFYFYSSAVEMLLLDPNLLFVGRYFQNVGWRRPRNARTCTCCGCVWSQSVAGFKSRRKTSSFPRLSLLPLLTNTAWPQRPWSCDLVALYKSVYYYYHHHKCLHGGHRRCQRPFNGRCCCVVVVHKFVYVCCHSEWGCWSDDMIKLCLYLFLGLLPVDHRLIHDLANVYTAAIADVKRTVLRVLETPVCTMHQSHAHTLWDWWYGWYKMTAF